MTKKSVILIGIGVLFTVFIAVLVSSFISFSNSEIELKNTYDQKVQEVNIGFDKMYKIISQKSQISLRNDSSFRENIGIIMSGRKDAPNLVMKWVQETNPNANYSEVADLYKDLSRAVEAQREQFFIQQKIVQDVVKEHNTLIQKFPGSFYNSFYKRPIIIYKPITSTMTEKVIETRKDDDIKLF